MSRILDGGYCTSGEIRDMVSGCRSFSLANWVVVGKEIAWFGRLRQVSVADCCDFLAVLMLLVRFFLTRCDPMRHPTLQTSSPPKHYTENEKFYE